MRNSATATSKVALIDVGQTCVQGLYLSYTCIYVYMSRRKSISYESWLIIIPHELQAGLEEPLWKSSHELPAII